MSDMPVSCSIGDAVGINRHFKEKNTDSHFNIYLGGTRSAQRNKYRHAETQHALMHDVHDFAYRGGRPLDRVADHN